MALRYPGFAPIPQSPSPLAALGQGLMSGYETGRERRIENEAGDIAEAYANWRTGQGGAPQRPLSLAALANGTPGQPMPGPSLPNQRGQGASFGGMFNPLPQGAPQTEAIDAAEQALPTATAWDPTPLTPFLASGKDASHLQFEPGFGNRMRAFLASAPEGAVFINSGYRSPERQGELYEQALAKYGSPEAARKWVAPPGRSRHNHGRAADLAFADDEARRWAHENAGRFGLAFPLAHEDWHVELAGQDGGRAPMQVAQAGRGTTDAGLPSIPTSATPQMPPSDLVRRMARNPHTRPLLIEMLKGAKAGERYVQYRAPDGTLFQVNTADGQASVLQAAPKPDDPTYRMIPVEGGEQLHAITGPGQMTPIGQVKPYGANSPSTNVNVAPGEKAFDKAGGELRAKRFDTIIQGGLDASGMIADVQRLRELGTQIGTGKGAEIKAALGPYAQTLGVDIEGLGDVQAYQAITSRLAPQMRVPGSGATSDYEMRTFLQSLPNLGRTPEGNRIVSDTLESLARHKQAAAEIAARALNGEIEPADAERQLQALPDPLSLWRQYREQSGGGEGRGGTTSSGLKWSVQ